MANRINNKYEYRRGLLDALNVQHNASDVMYEDEYRKKVLNGLGVEFTDDDINQKSRYRAKVVEGLASSGGGGGESDFSTAEVTVATTRRLGAQYSLICQAETGNSFVSAIINSDGSLYTGADDESVTVNNPDIYNILFTKNGFIDIYTPTPENITVEGNGEVITDDEGNHARAYGDCTITIS